MDYRYDSNNVILMTYGYEEIWYITDVEYVELTFVHEFCHTYEKNKIEVTKMDIFSL